MTEEPKYDFPFLECYAHPGPQRSYMVCRHIFDNKSPVFSFSNATDTSFGQVFCRQHDIDLFELKKPLNPDDFVPVCEKCVTFLSQGRIPEMPVLSSYIN